MGSAKPGAPLPTQMLIAGEPVGGPPNAEPPETTRSFGPMGMAEPPSQPRRPSRPMMAMPGAGQPFDAPLKADKEVKNGYRNRYGASIAVEAVCRVSEDSVACVRPDGKRDKNLEARLDRVLQGAPGGYAPDLTFKYKKKNRLIVLKKEYPAQPQGPAEFLSVVRLDGEVRQLGFSPFNLSALSGPYEPGKPRVEYELRAVAVPYSQKAVDVFVSSTRSEPVDGVVKLQKGFKLTQGALSIAYLSEKPIRDTTFGREGRVWEIAFKAQLPGKGTTVNFSPVFEGGRAGFAWVDAKGEVVRREPTGAGPGRMVGPEFSPATCYLAGASDGVLRVRTNVNPKHLEGLRATLLHSEIVKIKGVPLD